MGLSTSDLVQRVRDMLDDRPFVDTSTTTTTSTTVVVADTTQYAVGSIIEWQTGTVGFEQAYITALASGTNLTVIRGFNGTTAEVHASGDQIVRDPTFAGRLVQQAITQSMYEGWPYIWKTGTVNLTWDGVTKWYDLNALSKGIVNIVQKRNTTVVDFGMFRDRYQGDGLSYITQRNLPTTIVSSTNGIYFPQGTFDSRTTGGNSIVVTDVRALTGTTDIEDSASLPIAEAITHGAVARLLKAKETSRVTQGIPASTQQSVGTGSRYSLGTAYDQEYRRRLMELQIRLRETYDPDLIWEH